jgi:hypothetical protein
MALVNRYGWHHHTSDRALYSYCWITIQSNDSNVASYVFWVKPEFIYVGRHYEIIISCRIDDDK